MGVTWESESSREDELQAKRSGLFRSWRSSLFFYLLAARLLRSIRSRLTRRRTPPPASPVMRTRPRARQFTQRWPWVARLAMRSGTPEMQPTLSC